jgi:hypothetical protein
MTPDERFWAKVYKTDSCWLWTAAQIKGYGQLGRYGRSAYAHRVSWEIHKGPIPHGMIICHKCDVPLCVNPDHLFMGTQADNVADMISKGRKRSGCLRGSKNPVSKLDERDVPKIRKMSSEGMGVREIAPFFGVSKSTIHNVVSKKWWRHI